MIGPQTNVALVSPLLRLENNHCHIEESEYVLKKAHKYSELIILYEKKGLHQKGEEKRVAAPATLFVAEADFCWPLAMS